MLLEAGRPHRSSATTPERGGRTLRFSRNRDLAVVASSPVLYPATDCSPDTARSEGRLGHRRPSGAGRRRIVTNLASHLPSDGQQRALPIASKCSTSKMTPPTMAGTSCRCSRRIWNWSPEDLRPAKSDRPGSMCRSARQARDRNACSRQSAGIFEELDCPILASHYGRQL